MATLQTSTGKGNTTSNTTTVWDHIINLENNLGVNNGTPIKDQIDNINLQLSQIATLPKGADNTGVVSARSIIQSALNTGKGELLLPEGNFYLDFVNGATELLLMSKPMKIKGAGIGKTNLIVASNTPITCDVLRINRTVLTGDGAGYSLSDFSIISQGGTPARHGINIDTTEAGKHLKNMIIERVQVDPFGGKGIQVTNPVNTDGFFTSVIRDNIIANGIYLERAGDSIQIERNKLYGKNYGVYADLVSGANSLLISSNNITSELGCVFINGGQTDPRLVFNNFETAVNNTSVDRALVVLKGGSGKLRTPTIAFNTFSMLGTFVDIGLLADNVQFGSIYNNYFGRSNSATQLGYVITSNSYKMNVGKNWITDSLADTGYTDNGVATMGTYKGLTLQSGFTAKTGIEQPSYFFDEASIVNLVGAFNKTDNTWLDNNAVAILPSGARPKSTQYFPATCFITNVGYSTVTIAVTGAGNVMLYGVNSKTIDWISLCGISFLAYQ